MENKFKPPASFRGFIATLSFVIYLIGLGRFYFAIALFIASFLYLLDV